MKNSTTLLFLLCSLVTSNAQTATSITNLQTPVLDESSGLIIYNDNLITHTDSGGESKLYEINRTTGAVLRTILVANATNYDWEDITQDETHIFIGDIGNNSGNRTNLKVYKISKADYADGDNVVTAEVISYAYANQTDFTNNVNNNNWDAEALISYKGKLLIFTKNWANNQTNVYSISKISGTQTAVLESSYNVEGLITGADSTADERVIFLTGYSNAAAPFMYTIHNIPSDSFDVFSGTISSKITNIVPLGNQIEAIALFASTPTKQRLYLSNEKYMINIGAIPFVFPAKFWSIEIESSTLEVPEYTADFTINIFPNPVENILKLSTKVDEIVLYDLWGRIITRQYLTQELSLQNLNAGIYTAEIKRGDSTVFKKVIKK